MQPLERYHPVHVLAWLVPRADLVVLKKKFIDFLTKRRANCVKSRILNPEIEHDTS
jgi:hypothetical protein